MVLLGEKEEELEAAISDLSDVKDMYKSHMEDLVERVARCEQSAPKRD
jgi:hypothetical protein